MPTKLSRITINVPPYLMAAVKVRAAADNRTVANYLADLVQKNFGLEGDLHPLVAAEEPGSYTISPPVKAVAQKVVKRGRAGSAKSRSKAS